MQMILDDLFSKAASDFSAARKKGDIPSSISITISVAYTTNATGGFESINTNKNSAPAHATLQFSPRGEDEVSRPPRIVPAFFASTAPVIRITEPNIFGSEYGIKILGTSFTVGGTVTSGVD